MLDLTKPLLTNINGKWEDCELGKRVGEKYVVYIGDTYACVHEDQLRDKMIFYIVFLNDSPMCVLTDKKKLHKS